MEEEFIFFEFGKFRGIFRAVNLALKFDSLIFMEISIVFFSPPIFPFQVYLNFSDLNGWNFSNSGKEGNC